MKYIFENPKTFHKMGTIKILSLWWKLLFCGFTGVEMIYSNGGTLTWSIERACPSSSTPSEPSDTAWTLIYEGFKEYRESMDGHSTAVHCVGSKERILWLALCQFFEHPGRTKLVTYSNFNHSTTSNRLHSLARSISIPRRIYGEK